MSNRSFTVATIAHNITCIGLAFLFARIGQSHLNEIMADGGSPLLAMIVQLSWTAVAAVMAFGILAAPRQEA